jgi:RNA polymerase sigma factor (sigma-70 family)
MVKHKARKAVGKAGIKKHDLPDIEHDLMLALLKGMKRYDSAKSKRRTFASMLLNARLNSIYRFRLNPSRKPYLEWSSLNVKIETGENEFSELIELVNSNGTLEDEGLIPFDFWEKENLRIDMASVIKRMPEKLQNICKCLQKKGISATAKELHISRTTIYRSIDEIRRFFINNGLEIYLKN